jgi:Holliday junction resolvase RusA-like endonuclease
MDIRIKVDMVPHGKAVEITVQKTNKGRSFGSLKRTDETEAWESEFARLIAHQLPSYQLDFPVRIDISAVFPRPKYMCKVFKRTGRPKYAPGLLPFPKKPDWDNVVKSVQDSLKAHWTDDQLVTWGEVIESFVELDLSRVDKSGNDWIAAQLKPRITLRLRSVAQDHEADAAISLAIFQASVYGIEGKPLEAYRSHEHHIAQVALL